MASQPPDAPPAPGEPPASPESPFWNVVLPILGAIGTGIGILGFVIFFGGFIVWTRFDATGLPADRAVAAVPRNDLVVTGASFLVPAVLAAVAAVALAFVLWDVVVGNRRRRRVAEHEVRHTNAVANVHVLEAREERLQWHVASTRERMERLELAIKESDPHSDDRRQAREGYDAADQECRSQLAELASLQETELPVAIREQVEAKLALDVARQSTKLDRSELWRLVAIGGVPMIVAQLIVIYLARHALNFGQAAVLVGVMAASLAVAIAVASWTRNFAWYALCVFLGVAVLIAFATYERTRHTTKVSPVAAVDGAAPITGFFVAETSDAVYIAQPGAEGKADDRAAMTLVRISKKQLTGLTVGALMERPEAYKRSIELALTLCRREKSTATEAESRSKSASSRHTATERRAELRCPLKEIKALRERLTSAEARIDALARQR